MAQPHGAIRRAASAGSMLPYGHSGRAPRPWPRPPAQFHEQVPVPDESDDVMNVDTITMAQRRLVLEETVMSLPVEACRVALVTEEMNLQSSAAQLQAAHVQQEGMAHERSS